MFIQKGSFGNLGCTHFCVIGVSQQLCSLLTHRGQQPCSDISELRVVMEAYVALFFVLDTQQVFKEIY